MMLHTKVQESAAYLRDSLPQSPRIGIVLGSGLADIADQIEDAACIPYPSVPYMAASTAPGHRGCFICGNLGGNYVICMQGRLHPYEGHSARDIAFPIQVMAALGVDTLIITNATGGINESYRPGDLVLIADHINLTGDNPLIGPPDETVGPRFSDMVGAYTPELRDKAQAVAGRLGIELKEGVYIGVKGPSFETPAEIRAFRVLGADVVGMSSVFEVIAAVNCGMKVLGISLVTNMGAGMSEVAITSDEIDAIGQRRAVQICSLVRELLHEI